MYLFTNSDGKKIYAETATKQQLIWKLRDLAVSNERLYRENEETKATLKEFSDKLCAVIAYIVDTYGEEAAHAALSYQKGE